MANHNKLKDTGRALLFSYNEARPEDMWVCPRPEKLCNDLIADDQIRLPDPELESGDYALVSLFIDYNYVQGMKLNQRLRIVFTSEHQEYNAALLTACFVLLSLVRMADTPEMRPSIYNYTLTHTAQAPIQGILIRCTASGMHHPRYEAFIPTLVDHMHPIRGLHTSNNLKVGKVSTLSDLLGLCLRLRAYRVPGHPFTAANNPFRDSRNFQACKLMAHKDQQPDRDFLPNQPCGDVLVVQEDDNGLSIDDLTTICIIANQFLAGFLHPQDPNLEFYQKKLRAYRRYQTRFTNILSPCPFSNDYRNVSAVGPSDLYKSTETHREEEWDVVVSPEVSGPGSVAGGSALAGTVGQLPRRALVIKRCYHHHHGTAQPRRRRRTIILDGL
ncbi:hypothetical protein B0T21DRAFT_422322 [Apiosordaria backusii]|uniref:Uncharacterized protein n=1 Tax=Apiosordaria backusii TaxID=314023 RepID=A0AA40B2M7_9PEZI|nr:hypothetical protein B0T21DRAFT_422322 [Apiosordaria backusii]